MFEKDSVKITNAKEFTFVPLFRNARSGTNGWKTADYKNPMRRAIALEVMHILRPQRTTYVTAWQVGFFERVLKGNPVHWARIFYDLVWVNASTDGEEDCEETEEEDNGRTRVPSQTTARGPIEVDVLPTRERQESQLAKKRKVLTNNEEDSILESRMEETKIAGIWQSSTCARPKKKANHGVVVSYSSDNSVEKTDATTLATTEEKKDEPTLQVLEEGPSAVPVEVPMEVAAEPSEERTETACPSFQSSE
ncbi:hypothetical protein AXG93_673s1490 [Marchantia polymorpha subsp. ruderalis]|uniref:Uncharacterized protein n=1 Tax=Marchantia polymorpha subsp. ruderalis TaxID=1480154 RepID=A0A176WKY7_MARPO|nr:hypothetical protein AXG93_673s1490 [Marchantia polymorpha subsp. ruderalis]